MEPQPGTFIVPDRPADPLWCEIVSLIRCYAAVKYGDDVTAITIHLERAKSHIEPFPNRFFTPGARPGEAPIAGRPWASGNEPKRLSDWQQVYWPGVGQFRFSDTQAKVVRKLWEAWEAGSVQVGQSALLRAAGSVGTRLRDLFSRSDAWGRLIVQGGSPGSYRLAPLPGDEATEATPEPEQTELE